MFYYEHSSLHDPLTEVAGIARQDTRFDPPRAAITDPDEVAGIAAAIADHGAMAMDIEFVSEDRYIPELALVQLAWGDAREPALAVVDYLAVGRDGMAPVLELVERDDIETYSHAARQDLGLLMTRFQVRARNFWDTQIAALFAGHGDQIGYAAAVHKLLGITLDKSSQYTDWLHRPLRSSQLHYAYADVAHMPALWERLRGQLAEQGRLAWTGAESEALAVSVTPPTDPEVAFLDVRGWRGLDGQALGSLQSLAAWRQRKALDKNLPPSWILPDKAMVSLCRTQARTERALAATRGVDKAMMRRHGRTVLRRIAQGAKNGPPADVPESDRPSLSGRASLWAAVATSVANACATAAGLPAHLVVDRDDIERLAAWFDDGARGDEPDIRLLNGWRREVAGTALLSWFAGESAIAMDPDGAGLVLLSTVSDTGPE